MFRVSTTIFRAWKMCSMCIISFFFICLANSFSLLMFCHGALGTWAQLIDQQFVRLHERWIELTTNWAEREEIQLSTASHVDKFSSTPKTSHKMSIWKHTKTIDGSLRFRVARELSEKFLWRISIFSSILHKSLINYAAQKKRVSPRRKAIEVEACRNRVENDDDCVEVKKGTTN